MRKKMAKRYALTEQGVTDVLRGVFWTVLVNLCKMLPVGLLAWALGSMIDALTNGTNIKAALLLFWVGGLLALSALFVTFFFQYKAVYNTTYEESAKRRIRLAEILRKLPLSFFGERDLTDLTSTIMADCEGLEKAFSHFYPQMWGTYISTCLIAIGMLLFDWRMALALLWVVPVSLALVYGARRAEKKHVDNSISARRAATDAMQEVLECVPEIKACNQKENYLFELNGKLEYAEKAAIRSELFTGSTVTAAQAFLKVGIATTILVGITLYVKGGLSLAPLLMFLIAATRLYDPLGSLFINMAAVFATEVKIERMQKIENEQTMTGLTEYSLDSYDISFENVTFAYRDGEPILSDVSFIAKQGEVTALVGPSGGGKSTAAKLAGRFWDPSKGRITVGDVDIRSIDSEALLTNYAIVFQDVVLFADTVMENIRLGKRDATDEEVIQAAKAAQCDGFVSSLPEGYQTMIGENGARLSGGERQRISIARAILKNAPIILLDEATASLDVENESAVQAALSDLIRNKTVLIIAHRMRTVMNADKIVLLSEGKIAETGRPDELLLKKGLFYHMAELQNEGMSWTA
jgi:ATP-binding cassette subfamily B protein IrtB